jgi:hypothetical protein
MAPPDRENEPGVKTVVPPQVFEVTATPSRPAGSGSVNTTPVIARLFGFASANATVDVWLWKIVDGLKTLVNIGGASTVTVAVAVLPVPPLMEETVTALVSTPAATPVTFTEKIQFIPEASAAPVRFTVELPATAVMGPPPHEPVSPFGVATTNPAGKLSVKEMPISVSGFPAGFETAKVKLVVPPSGIEVAPKALEIDGGPSTATLAVAVLPIPILEVTVTELFCVPTPIPCTFTEKVQLAPAASVAPVRLILDRLTVNVPPPQEPFTGGARIKPPGKLSVKAILVRLPCALGFKTVKLRLVVPENGMEAVPKLLKI